MLANQCYANEGTLQSKENINIELEKFKHSNEEAAEESFFNKQSYSSHEIKNNILIEPMEFTSSFIYQFKNDLDRAGLNKQHDFLNVK